ncbi:chromatin-remodeling complex ATPase chain Iswi-like [Anopheles cruzii]|uniref:chromatin-remodeling complex ATPase chain Iswi-like n=1 Tax=Anopheles cruzii TaxID=68878 RepID=UPI0022EC8A43|nr:chromatin-remodeling complex ATPase chain Iswi-like [Anopheles cruzii]
MDKENVPVEPITMDDKAQEEQAFRDMRDKQRVKQLESLEQKLSAFSHFSRSKYEAVTHKRRGRPLAANRDRDSDRDLNKGRQDLANNNGTSNIYRFESSPSFINGQMHDYQIEGLNWLILLHQSGLNGILADEMGLGKTIQSISMIGYLMYIRKVKGPFLVVAPLRTVDNWMKEFAMFMPSARVLRAHAIDKGKQPVFSTLRAAKTWDVAVTSYEFIRDYRAYFGKLNWTYAILDEGHRAKNESTRFSREFSKCNIASMILLTGTPVHNNLHELWALLNLMMPSFFNNADHFNSWFEVENCIDPHHEQTIRLKNLLKQLMLRRTKDELKTAIPPKVHILISMPPTREMLIWTRNVLDRKLTQITGLGLQASLPVRQVLTFLRQAVLHPYLIPGAEPVEEVLVTQAIVDYSPKMIVLDRLLEKLFQRGSKVLIFSQFVKIIRILQDYMDWRGYEYCVLTGKDKDNQEQIDEFSRPGSKYFVFLISTRAGGLGINLVTADTVIFYDIDYNPQMDYQAEDRAHRFGQRSKVHIIRLIVRGSVEESMYSIAERKKLLDASVIRQALTKKEQIAAVDYQRKLLSTVGVIDVQNAQQQVDKLIHDMGPLVPWAIDEGKSELQDNCTIVVSGNPCLPPIDLDYTAATGKRKADEDLILTGKRTRGRIDYFSS